MENFYNDSSTLISWTSELLGGQFAVMSWTSSYINPSTEPSAIKMVQCGYAINTTHFFHRYFRLTIVQ